MPGLEKSKSFIGRPSVIEPTAFPKNPLRVGLVQTSSSEDVGDNIQQVFAGIDQMAQKGAKLICFPECVFYLRVGKDLHSDGIFDLTEDIWGDLKGKAEELNVHVLLGSISHRLGEKVYNSTIHIGPNRDVQAVYSKIHLFDVDVKGASPVRESEQFVHGSRPAVIEILGWRFGLSICYDLRFAELFSVYSSQNIHALFVPSAFLIPTGKAHWHVLLRARAIENQVFVVAPAQGGEHHGRHGGTRKTFGHSLVVAPWGNVLAELDKDGDASCVVDLDPMLLKKMRSQIPQAQHRRL